MKYLVHNLKILYLLKKYTRTQTVVQVRLLGGRGHRVGGSRRIDGMRKELNRRRYSTNRKLILSRFQKTSFVER